MINRSALDNFTHVLEQDERIQPISGDCFLVAMVLEDVLDGPCMGVYDGDVHISELPAHVMIDLDGHYIDGTGAWKREAFRQFWHERLEASKRVQEANHPDYRAPQTELAICRFDLGRIQNHYRKRDPSDHSADERFHRIQRVARKTFGDFSPSYSLQSRNQTTQSNETTHSTPAL